MAYIYIALVDTPGIFAAIIRRFLKQNYIHVVIAADAELTEAYSVGRRNPSIPLIAGFEKENKNQILHAFPMAMYRICELECTPLQKKSIMEQLHMDYRNRFHIHYAVLALPFIVMGTPFYIKNQYTCSSYVARILEKNGIMISKKHFSLVTPKDFYEYKNMHVIFEGKLSKIAEHSFPYKIRRISAYE
ncbi:MAG: hypothetical protein ACI4C1_07375 [Lachnospiraceae bacterium]